MRRTIGLIALMAFLLLGVDVAPATVTGTRGIVEGAYTYYRPCATNGHHVVLHLIGSITAGGKAFIGQTRSDLWLDGCPRPSAAADGFDIRGFTWGGGSIRGTCSGTVGFGPTIVGTLIGPFSSRFTCAVRIVTRLHQVASGSVAIAVEGYYAPDPLCSGCGTDQKLGLIRGVFRRG